MTVTWWQSLLIALVPALITAMASGIFSYFLAIRKSLNEIKQLAEKHKQEMEILREQHRLEIEKLQFQQEHEEKMKEQDSSVKFGESIISSIMSGIMGSDTMQKNIDKIIDEKFHEKEENNGLEGTWPVGRSD